MPMENQKDSMELPAIHHCGSEVTEGISFLVILFFYINLLNTYTIMY